MKILKLTLKAAAFEVMLTGEKSEEYRTPSKWIYSRLIDKKTKCNKEIDEVQFTNGYGKNRPVFRAKFLGHRRNIANPMHKQYSNGLMVFVPLGSCIIEIGEITFIHNINLSIINNPKTYTKCTETITIK